jgi:uncharacterized protein YjbI with pentapeptide repeats
MRSKGLRVMKDASRKTVDRLRAVPWQTTAYRYWKPLIGIVAVILCIVIWKVPQWQAASWEGLLGPKDLAKLENDARTILVQTLGGAVLLIGLYFTLKNLQLTEDRQITERYTRAVEQLGSDKLEVRLGAIYALERIARDSERDHWPIMEILTAYVREHAPLPGHERRSREQNHQPVAKRTADIQAVLTVLGRRTRTYGNGEAQRLNLRATNLSSMNLQGVHLEGADFTEANLARADFSKAHLEGACFRSAFLQGAHLRQARLEKANLMRAYLEEAEFSESHLERAQLRSADLTRAYLEGAYIERAILSRANLRDATLSKARQLTVEQLSCAKTLWQTVLDPPLEQQIKQRYPDLLKEPEEADW